jgi:hypothetical protein
MYINTDLLSYDFIDHTDGDIWYAYGTHNKHARSINQSSNQCSDHECFLLSCEGREFTVNWLHI